MSYFHLSQRVSRFFQKRRVREQLRSVGDPRQARGRRWTLACVLESV